MAVDLGCFEHVASGGAPGEGPLRGMAIGVKDLIDVGGMPTTAGSKDWSRMPAADAAVVAAVRAAGATIAGKLHTNEWAYGIDGRNPWRPPCRNPHDPERLPGGSSSGPAVAVAAGLVDGALGTDTSGSLRVPAALCGVVGLRPSPGRVPLDGVIPLAPSYDVCGPMAATVARVAALFEAIAGPPPAPIQAPAAPRIGVDEALLDAAHPAVAAVVRAAADALGGVEPVALAGLDDALAVHRTLQGREAALVHAAWAVERAPDVEERLAAGRAVTPAAYRAARAERGRMSAAILAALDDVDAILAPTTGCVAPRRDATDVELGHGRRVALREALLGWTVPFTQAPVPAVSVPVGTVDGLPVGAQLIGRPGADEALLALAARLETRPTHRPEAATWPPPAGPPPIPPRPPSPPAARRP